MNSLVPLGPMSTSRRRRSDQKHAGSCQFSSGLAASKAPGFLSSIAR
jgi:hypothetical protein